MIRGMSDKVSRYITTTLPYVNADPHIGFALEIVQADALARFWRASGHDVFFTTGTDEHGQKIFEKAKESGREVQEYVDHYAAQFGKLKEALDLSYDAFIRTTSDMHVRAAQEIWRRCAAKGDIYKKTYKGLYCVGDEAFMKESDLVDGKCPNHPNQELVEIEEENYFFRLSAYEDRILEYLEKPSVVIPEWRRQEAIAFVKGGLEDFSISREAARMSWGIPVPGDESQVMYVWFDALTNYISTLGWPDDPEGTFKKFWEEGATLQLAGKDQVRFQSIMWQAMLMSADVAATDEVFYHGFITSGGQKMSKSLGNVISPFDVVEKYGTDAARYMLLRHVHPTEDTDITWERMDEWYNANLANGLGNLVARIMKMAESYLTEPVTLKEPNLDYDVAHPSLVGGYTDTQLAIDDIWVSNVMPYPGINAVDAYIEQTKPYKLIKENPAEAQAIVIKLVQYLGNIALRLQPFMPDTASKILSAIVENKKPETLFARLEA